MAGKSLNKTNLKALGADVLADLLLEAVKGDAARQRRVRLALSSEQSPEDAAADIRKRLAQIRRAKSRISARAQRTLAKELTGLVALTEARIAPQDAELGFDLLWSLLHLAPDIYARTDDSTGTLGDVMRAAMEAIHTLAPRLDMAPAQLAEQVFEALQDNDFGAFDGVIPALSDALGDRGLAALKAHANAAKQTPVSIEDKTPLGRSMFAEQRLERAKDRQSRMLRMILSDIADAQGDVDSWLAQYSAQELSTHTLAPAAARRLLNAGRADEALHFIQRGIASVQRSARAIDTSQLDSAHFACLDALGHEDDLRRAMWARFETQLCAETLRRYLSRLPDFEDDEALHTARAHVRAAPGLLQALVFCVNWPDPMLAADIVQARHDALDGAAYDILDPTAQLLAPEHPLAACLVWRAMIRFALHTGRTQRGRHAARHLAACAQADMAITDYGAHQSHEAFVAGLRRSYPRRRGFWDRIDPQ